MGGEVMTHYEMATEVVEKLALRIETRERGIVGYFEVGKVVLTKVNEGDYLIGEPGWGEAYDMGGLAHAITKAISGYRDWSDGKARHTTELCVVGEELYFVLNRHGEQPVSLMTKHKEVVAVAREWTRTGKGWGVLLDCLRDNIEVLKYDSVELSSLLDW